MQVNGAGAWRAEWFIKPFLTSNPDIGRGVPYGEGAIASHLTVEDLSTPYVHFVTSGRFPVAEAFSQCAEPQRGRC